MTRTRYGDRIVTLKYILTVLLAIVVAQSPAVAAAAETPQFEVRHFSAGGAAGLPTIEQSARNVPVVAQVDVVVAGGGVAGVAAALAAARDGLSVALIEERNHFGQELTATWHFATAPIRPAPAWPLAEGICGDLTKVNTVRGGRLDPVDLRAYLVDKLRDEPRVKVYLFSMPTGVVMEGGAVRGVTMSNVAGRQIVLAKAVIDATPDARIAAAAGAKFVRAATGEKTVRRFCKAARPADMKAGPFDVPAAAGVAPFKAIFHDGFLELVGRKVVGDDVGADMAAAQAESLVQAFAVRDFLAGQGKKPKGFAPAPEIWIDEPPAVACRAALTAAEVAAMEFGKAGALQPAGVEGLLVAGRTATVAPEAAGVQALLCSGEAAAKAAAAVARKAKPLSLAVETRGPGALKDRAPDPADPAKPQVRELLAGNDSGIVYPYIRQAAAPLPVRGTFDVVVIGGGTSGAFSAIAAARQGARVALVDVLPNLGGIGTNRVNSYYWGVTWKSGLSEEIDVRARPTAVTGEKALGKNAFSGEEKKFVLQDVAQRAGVTVLYRSFGAGAVVQGDKVVGAVLENASGRHVVRAGMVIDATGQADVAAAAGARFFKGRAHDGFVHETEHGPLRDPLNPDDISTSYLKFPSYAVSQNIRESRRIDGDATITLEDALHARVLPGTVCLWRSNYDTHFPASANQDDIVQDWVGMMGLWRHTLVGSIPYGCLLPKGLENILVVGKSFSSTHDALIGARMQRDLQHLGEVAGVAAAMACRGRITARAVPVAVLQQELVRLGVLRAEDLAAASAKAELKTDPAAAAARFGTDAALDAMTECYLAGPAAAPHLRPILASGNPQAKEEAALVLGLLGDRAAVPALMEMLRTKNPRQFTYTLPNASSRASVPLYCSAVILLGRFQEKAAAPLILDLLRDPAKCPPQVASFGIIALGRIKDPAAVAVIRPYLAVAKDAKINRENLDFESHWGVRTNAARTLAGLGDRSGVPVLIELLAADQSLLRDYAQRLLEEITGQRFGKDAKAWAAWWAGQGPK